MKKSEMLKIMDKCGLTGFQKSVLLETLKIPKGEMRSYKQIAHAIGRPRAYRAVGTALKINPLAPMIPCHRVIKSNGDLGEYAAPGGTGEKARLLKIEKAI